MEVESSIKKDAYKKIENMIAFIKSQMKQSLGPKEKQRILKYIIVVIISIQVDNLYAKTVDQSGINALLELFGFEEKTSEKIKSLCNNGASVALLALLILNNLK